MFLADTIPAVGAVLVAAYAVFSEITGPVPAEYGAILRAVARLLILSTGAVPTDAAFGGARSIRNLLPSADSVATRQVAAVPAVVDGLATLQIAKIVSARIRALDRVAPV